MLSFNLYNWWFSNTKFGFLPSFYQFSHVPTSLVVPYFSPAFAELFWYLLDLLLWFLAFCILSFKFLIFVSYGLIFFFFVLVACFFFSKLSFFLSLCILWLQITICVILVTFRLYLQKYWMKSKEVINPVRSHLKFCVQVLGLLTSGKTLNCWRGYRGELLNWYVGWKGCHMRIV